MAISAVVGLALVRRQIERGEDRAEEQPGPKLSRHQVGVLALPAEAGLLRQRLLHDGGGVDEHLHIAARLRDQPARQRLQLRLDDLVIVGALRIDGDGAALATLR